MSQIKTTIHGLYYSFERGPVPIATTSHMITHDVTLAIEIARDLARSAAGQEIDPDCLAKTACDIVEALQTQFTQRRWRVKVPAVDADMLHMRYDIKRPKEAA